MSEQELIERSKQRQQLISQLTAAQQQLLQSEKLALRTLSAESGDPEPVVQRLACDRGAGVISIRTGADALNLWIEITDNSKGIDPKVLPKLFDPLFTTKAIGKGTELKQPSPCTDPQDQYSYLPLPFAGLWPLQELTRTTTKAATLCHRVCRHHL